MQSNPENETANDWTLEAITNGLSKLLCLSLEGQPSVEVIAGTAMAWNEAITHGKRFSDQQDPRLFADAFRVLGRRCRRWPAPVDFLDALPSRGADRMPVMLESGAAREVGMRHLADIAAKLRIVPSRAHAEVDDDSAA